MPSIPNALSELIARAESSPAIKKMLQAIRSPEEANALAESFSKSKATPASAELSDVMKNTDIPVNQEELFNPDVVRRAKVNPLPPAIPKELNLPISRSEAGVPSSLQASASPVDAAISDTMRDVTPNTEQSALSAGEGGNGEIPPSLAAPESEGLSPASKLGLGTAIGGAALLGLQGDTEIHPEEVPVTRQEASIAETPKVKAVAPSKEKTDTNDEEDTDESDVTPSQKTQAIAKEPVAETPAPQKQTPSAEDMLNFEQRGNNPNELAQLLAQQRQDIAGQQFMEGAARVGAGLSRTTPDTEMYRHGEQLAGLPVEQYKLRQANEGNDPNSGISQGMRDYMKNKLGVNVSDNATAEQMKAVLPMVYKDIEAKQAQASKSQDLAARLKEQQLMAQAHIEAARQAKQGQQAMAQATHELARQDKQHQQQQQQANKMDQQAEQLRGNPAIQQDMRTIQRVQNAMSIIKQYPDPNQIPPNIINILNTDLATIAGGGVPGEGLIHEVSTPTIQSKIGSGLQELLNKPTGAKAAAFVKQNEGIFNTLAGDAQNRLEERYRRIGNTLGHSVTPEDRENYRRTYLPSHTYDKNNDFVPTKQQESSAITPDPRDQAAIRTIMQNNPGISIQDASKALIDYKRSKAQQ